MAYRKVTCFITGNDRDAAALATAMALVAPARGNVAAMFLRADPRDVMPMIGEGLSGALIQDLMKTLDQENTTRAAQAQRNLQTALDNVGGSLCARPPGPVGITGSFTDATGVAEDVMAAAARLSDATVFPSVIGEDRTAVLVGLEAALLEGGRPLVVAPIAPPTQVGKVVAIAWNGRAQSARALALAMPVIAHAESVHILGVDTMRTDASEVSAVVEYLAWHGIPAQGHSLTGAGSVATQLLTATTDVGADLLIMGGYGHSRLRELILGGVTKAMLNQATIPLLMAH